MLYSESVMSAVRPNMNFFKRNTKTEHLKHRGLSGQKKLRSVDLKQIFVTNLNIINTVQSLSIVVKNFLR